MDKEIIYINNILIESENGLTTSEISKKIYELYKTKVSKQIVKNYLWSYFRNIIEYNSSNYKYKLDNDQFLLDDIFVTEVEKTPRALSVKFNGPHIYIEFDKTKHLETYIKALAILNFKSSVRKKNADLFKQINRLIEQIEDKND